MNPIHILVFFFGRRMAWHAFNLCVLALVSWGLVDAGVPYMDYVLWISLIIVSTIAIWRAGDFFQPAATYIQERHQIPESVKAAIIDAIASSFPEFCVAVIAVVMLGRAEVGISSIVGSALYNVLIIPAAAGLVAKDPMKVNREVVWRDNLYYIGVVVLLLAALSFPQFSAKVENTQEDTQYWGVLVALIFIAAYVVYVLLLHHAYKQHKKKNPVEKEDPDNAEEEDEPVNISNETHAWLWIIGMMLVMGGASHLLVEASIKLGELAGIDAVIMGFVVIAAGTSVPDTVLSVISAKKGNYDAAISNVFGSNIFDICICLSVPILLALAISGDPTPVVLPQIELIWCLIAANLVAFYFFRSSDYTLSKPESVTLGGIYLLIVVLSLTI